MSMKKGARARGGPASAPSSLGHQKTTPSKAPASSASAPKAAPTPKAASAPKAGVPSAEARVSPAQLKKDKARLLAQFKRDKARLLSGAKAMARAGGQRQETEADRLRRAL